MSLLIRHKQTGNYLQAHSLWTPDPAVAVQFNSGLKLIDYIEEAGTENPEEIEVIVVPESQAEAHRALQ